jgi:hypothetical protein
MLKSTTAAGGQLKEEEGEQVRFGWIFGRYSAAGSCRSGRKYICGMWRRHDEGQQPKLNLKIPNNGNANVNRRELL